MFPLILPLFFALSAPAPGLSASFQIIPDYIPPAQQSVLLAWLNENPGFRVATDNDCECADEIAEIRDGLPGTAWKPNPNFHPYYVDGDFNRDKQLDFAVILIQQSKNGQHFLAIFNGPFSKNAKPAFLSAEDGALFYGAPRPKPYSLVIGFFNSEGAILEAKGGSYEFVADE